MTIPQIAFAQYRLHFRAQAAVRFSHFAGSTWRGALGHSLKRLACVTQLPKCPECPLFHACAHAYLFETPPPPDTEKMRKYPSVPHPFILNAPIGMKTLNPGQRYTLEVTLLGNGNRHLPYLLHALERAGRAGIGKGRAPLVLEQVEREPNPGTQEWVTIYQPGGPVMQPFPRERTIPDPPAGSTLRIEFQTPTRFRHESRVVRPQDFHFADLFSNLLRRISMLTYFHGDHPLETDFAGLTQRAKLISIQQQDLHWLPWNRYSSRQEREVKMDGLVGSIELGTAGLDEFWPYLWLGQYVHAGAGTVMGQGKIALWNR